LEFGEGVAGQVKEPKPINLARELRRNQTETEIKIWVHLRAKRFNGVKFKDNNP
jgi:very-short-patch-repair endonuclease